MKKKLFFSTFCIAIACVGAVIMSKQSMPKDLLMENVEALSHSESDVDCHYSNGRTAFTSQQGGGAYDCCMKWRSYKPKNDQCK